MAYLWEKSKDFLQRAFTVIFIGTIIIWFLQSFNLRFQLVADSQQSILASIAGILEPVFRPIGLGNWKIITSLISGFIAKESVVSTMEILFAGNGEAMLSEVTAAVMLVFSLLYTPCVASIAAIKRELGIKWAVAVAGWQCGVAWIAGFAVFIIGSVL